MALILIEGARKAGKTHLLQQLQKNSPQYQVFKFDFTSCYTGLDLLPHERPTHMFGLSKEIMLHQLNRDGVLGKSPLVIDRGILTCAVWGVLEKRVSVEEVEAELLWMIDQELFKNTQIIDILGTSTERREKDVWDHMDEKIEEEKELFSRFFSFLSLNGVSIVPFNNSFDEESEEKFRNVIDKFYNMLCVES
jgi:hypothetical protein